MVNTRAYLIIGLSIVATMGCSMPNYKGIDGGAPCYNMLIKWNDKAYTQVLGITEEFKKDIKECNHAIDTNYH